MEYHRVALIALLLEKQGARVSSYLLIPNGAVFLKHQGLLEWPGLALATLSQLIVQETAR